jgi:hypothetical protein
MADSKISALPAASAAAAANELAINEAGTSKKVSVAQLKTFIKAEDVVLALGADASNSTTTPASVTGLEIEAGVGTFLLKYWIVYRAAATSTGIEMYLDHSGTVTRLVGTWYTLTTGGTATTGVADQSTTAIAQMMEGKGQRAKNIASGVMQGVDTANADQFAVFEAVMIVTVSGTLKLMFRSEVAASAVSIMTGTTLTMTQVA